MKIPYAHQLRGVQEFLANKNLFQWDAGTGKTLGALLVAQHLNAKKLLILSPKSAHLSWQEEAQLFDVQVEIMTYEKFNQADIEISKYDFFVFDECHHLKNPKAQRTRKALTLFKQLPPDTKLGLSGTPLEREYEIYSQLAILDYVYTIRNFGTWKEFKKHFYVDRWNNPVRPMDDMRRKIEKAVKDKFYIVHRDDVLELPSFQEILINLANKNIDMPDTYENFIRSYAIAQGIDPETKTMKDLFKIDWIWDFLQANPDTIVFSLFKTPVYYLRDKGLQAYFITGEDKKDLEKAIQIGDKPIVATYSVKEGANLQRYRNIVFLTLPLSWRDYEQARSRAYRSGQTRKVVAYVLLGSLIDKQVLSIIKRKQSIHEYYKKQKEVVR